MFLKEERDAGVLGEGRTQETQERVWESQYQLSSGLRVSRGSGRRDTGTEGLVP